MNGFGFGLLLVSFAVKYDFAIIINNIINNGKVILFKVFYCTKYILLHISI